MPRMPGILHKVGASTKKSKAYKAKTKADSKPKTTTTTTVSSTRVPNKSQAAANRQTLRGNLLAKKGASAKGKSSKKAVRKATKKVTARSGRTGKAATKQARRMVRARKAK